MTLPKRFKQLAATVKEQEATILHLRTENSVLLAKLAAKRRRKPVTPRQMIQHAAQAIKRMSVPIVITSKGVRDQRGVLKGVTRG